MNDQRFSLARLTAGGMLVLAAFGASAQEMSRNPNPFQRPQAAAGAPSTATPALDANTRTPESLSLPPPIPAPADGAAPQLPLPPKGIAASIPMLPPPVPAAPARETVDTATASNSAVPKMPPPAQLESSRPRAFMSRDKIEASRARCQVSLKGRTIVQMPASEGEQSVHLTGANGCLTAMSADADWLDVNYSGNDELVLSAQANPNTASRHSDVTVVTPNQTYVLSVRQAGAELKVPAPAPAPAAPGQTNPPTAPTRTTAPTAQAEVPPAPVNEYDPAQARMADANVSSSGAAQMHAAMTLPSREAAAELVKIDDVVPAPAASFALPEVREGLSDAALARLRDIGEAPDGVPAHALAALSLPHSASAVALIEATDLPPHPAMAFALPEVKEGLSAAALARLRDFGESPDVAVPAHTSFALPGRDSVVTLLSVAELPRAPTMAFALPEVKEGLSDAALARLRDIGESTDDASAHARAARILSPQTSAVASVVAAELPAAPAVTFALPDVKEGLSDAALARMRDIGESASANPRARIVLSAAGPAAAGTLVKVADRMPPPAVTFALPDVKVEIRPLPAPAARAQGVLRTFTQADAAAAARLTPRPAAVAAKPVAAPDGYMTLDEYSADARAKKSTR